VTESDKYRAASFAVKTGFPSNVVGCPLEAAGTLW
jgi:hypothetical protein